MKSLLELIKALYGSKAIASTIGTKTNVIRLPSGKLQKYISKDLNIEAASDAAAQNAYNEMKELIPEITKMNDGERLIFEGNLRRLKNRVQPQEAEIVTITTKEPISKEGIGQLLEEVGQTAKPGTLIGDIESRINRLKSLSKEGMKMEDVLKDFATSQKGMARLQDEGLVRATARQIMYKDIQSGKLKVSKEVEDIITGRASGDPIDSFRQFYGEDALEQLDSLTPDLRQLKTEVEAEKLARSKFKFEPDINRPPGSVSIEEAKKAEQEFGINKPAKVSDLKTEATRRTSVDDLIDEYNANQDRLLLTDDEGGTLITYPEYNRLKDRNEQIAKILEEKGIKSTPEVETKPEGIVIPFKKKPEEFSIGGRAGFKIGSGKKIVEGIISTVSKSPKRHSKDIIETANLITPDYNDAKMAAQQIADTYAETKFGKDFYELSDKKQNEIYTKAYDYVVDVNRQSKEGLKKIEGLVDDINQKRILKDFDVKDREPNAKGGSAGLDYLMGL